MSANPPFGVDELHAFADHQLSAERAGAIKLLLEHEPALAARVAEIRRQNAWLRDALEPWLAEALPRSLLAAAAAPSTPRRRHGRRAAAAAASKP